MAGVEPMVWALAARLRASFGGLLLLHGLELLLQVLLLGEQGLDLLLQFADGRVDLAGEGLDELQLLVRPLVGLQAGDGLDAPDAGGDGRLGDDAEQADLARGAGVRAAAKLHRVAVQRGGLAADLHHAHHVAVFLAEELHDVLARS